MSSASRCVLGLLLLSFLLAACSTSGPSLPGDPDPSPAIEAIVDASRAVSIDVPIGGGIVSAEAADGTTYSLVIPDGALLDETTITMTPILSLDGFSIDGAALHGVQLEPDGLQLYQAATLTIAPPTGSAQPAISLALSGSPHELYLYPLRPDPSVLQMDLLHFSSFMTYVGDGIHLPVEASELAPEQAAAMIEHAVAELLAEARRRALDGEEPDPELDAKIQQAFRQYFESVVAPRLPAIRAGCEGLGEHLGMALGWAKQAELLGLASVFEAEAAQVFEAAGQGLRACWEQTVEPCVDPSDAEQMGMLIDLARQMIMLGMAEGDSYSPLDPSLGCGIRGSAEHVYTSHFEGSAWGTTTTSTSGMIWVADDELSSPGTRAYRLVGATVSYDDRTTTTNGIGTCDHETTKTITLENPPGPGYDQGPLRGTLYVYSGQEGIPDGSYYGFAYADFDATTHTECSDGHAYSVTSEHYAALLSMDIAAMGSYVMTSGGALQGTHVDEVDYGEDWFTNTYTWDLTMTN